MLDIFIQLNGFAQVVHIAVHPHTGKARPPGGVQLLGLGTFARAHNGCQHLKTSAFRQLEDFVHHFIDGLLVDLPPADRAVRHADAGVHQAQVVVNFGDGTHGGTRVMAGGFLVDGDSRGKPGDLIDIGLFHLPQKLAGIAGKAFHIAALPIGIDGVKRKARLA